MNRWIALVVISIVALGCEEAELVKEVETIRYGTSFGMCVGYCLTDVEISPVSGSVITYGWDNSVTPKSREFDFTEGEFRALLETIDFEKFQDLDPVIGCPDCADGGAEWIELTAEGRTKKVKIDYRAEIDGLSETLGELRRITQENRPE